jgi:squalene-hopene/tetraprenyl-beta-curcumene cyclase
MTISCRVEAALASALRFLLDRQTPDGAWRSDTYGVFKGGDALTPLVLSALLALPAEVRGLAYARTGLAYLAGMACADGTIDEGPHGLSYPVYTASLSVAVLSHAEAAGQEAARAAWLNYLRARQLTEALGWQPVDREYGGWGYAHDLPRKPALEPLTLPNLSATVFALEAIRAASCGADDPAVRRGLAFVCRCQNYPDDPSRADPLFDDGGFFFLHGDPPRNKAGSAGTDRAGCERWVSYGSTSADGLRGLLACRLGHDDARVAAARSWLVRNFSAGTHPGRFPETRRAVQASVYFYYSWSVAHALAACPPPSVSAEGAPGWAEALADALLRRQRADGSWLNEAVEVREDDPIVATALALGALAACRRALRAG